MQALPPFRCPFSQTSFVEHRVNADLTGFPLELIKRQFEAQSLTERGRYLSPPMSRSPPPPDSTKIPSSSETAQQGQTSQPRRVRSNPSLGGYVRIEDWRRQELWQSGEAIRSDRSGEVHPLQGALEEIPRSVQEHRPHSSSPTTHRTPFASQPSLPSPRSARRTKAHVPSACVNCKRKHLRCEQRRPCHRCVQAGKEVGF